jgi:hypothetical protein
LRATRTNTTGREEKDELKKHSREEIPNVGALDSTGISSLPWWWRRLTAFEKKSDVKPEATVRRELFEIKRLGRERRNQNSRQPSAPHSSREIERVQLPEELGKARVTGQRALATKSLHRKEREDAVIGRQHMKVRGA